MKEVQQAKKPICPNKSFDLYSFDSEHTESQLYDIQVKKKIESKKRCRGDPRRKNIGRQNQFRIFRVTITVTICNRATHGVPASKGYYTIVFEDANPDQGIHVKKNPSVDRLGGLDLVDSTWWTRLGGPTYTTTFFRRHKSPPNQRMPSLLDVCRNLACAILVYNTTNSDLLTYHEKCTALHPMLDAAIEDWFFTSNSTYLNTALFFVCKRHVSNTTFFEF